jgi:hypothetical protein
MVALSSQGNSHMINHLAAAASVAAALLLSGPAAQAANDIKLLTVDTVDNTALLQIAGSDNRVQIMQDSAGFTTGNRLTLTIKGDLNGGPLASQFTGAALLPGLTPGSILQKGQGNSIAMDVTGSKNLFAVAQNGSGNIVAASIAGLANQASVSQVGNNNVAGFSQHGNGNIVSIMQRSW